MKAQADLSRAWATQQAAEWFVENRSGPLSASRRREFIRWLRTSPLHILEYLAIARSATDLAEVAKGVDTSLAELLAEALSEDRVVPLLAQGHAERHVHPLPRRSFDRFAEWRPSLGIAASLAACLIIAIAGWLWAQHPQAGHRGDREYIARAGQDRTVRLTDDTAMYLTADSAVLVRFNEHRRLVQVERGQALFEVAHDATRPFQVRAGNTVIEDVGTVFDVSTQPQQTLVTVLEGQVAIWGVSPHSGQSSRQEATSAPTHPLRTELRAGEQASILPTGMVRTSRPRDLAQAAPWLRPQIVFDGQTLAAVAAEFNRHNREQIEISNPRIGAIPVSGVFHSYDVASFESFLNSVQGVQAVITNGRLQVRETPNSSSSMPSQPSSLP